MDITEEQWHAHPQFRQELAELLKNKTLNIALGIVRRAGLKPTPMNPGVDLIQFFALMGSKRDGYFEGITNLTDLALSKPVKPPERKAFEGPKPNPQVDSDRTSAP